MIRKAEYTDIPALMSMGRKFYESSPYVELAEFDPMAVKQMYTGMIKNDGAEIIVAEVDNIVIGFIAIAMATVPFQPLVTVAYETLLWVEKGFRRYGIGSKLIQIGEDWGRQHNATLMVLAHLDTSQAHLYKENGYTEGETAFTKRL